MNRLSMIAMLAVLSGTALSTAPAAEKMYWIEAVVDSVSLMRANVNGSGVEGLFGLPMGGPTAVAVDKSGGKIYFGVSNGGQTLRRANLDGSDVELLLALPQPPVDIDLDVSGGSVYWTSLDGILRAGQDGSGLQTLLGGLSSPRGLSVDVENGKMYWTEEGPPRLRRANLDGSGVEDLIPLTGDGYDTTLVSSLRKVYWVQSLPLDRVHRANLDGSSPEELPTPLTGPTAIDFDPQTDDLYLIDTQLAGQFLTGRIVRAEADGSGDVDVLMNLSAPWDIVLDTPLPGGEPVPAASGVGLAALVATLLATWGLVVARRRRAARGSAPD